MNDRVCRWGVLGTARATRKTWAAIHAAGNSTLCAVASRCLDRAEALVRECQPTAPFVPVPRAFGDYQDLLADDGIDAVYIPLPTGLRAEWVIRVAEAGKHVLAEKPAGCSAAEVAEMLAACARHNVQFMDATAFVHGDRLERIRQVIAPPSPLGTLKRVTTCFSFFASDDRLATDIRAHSALEPQGCLGDLGYYTARFSLWAVDFQSPEWVSSRVLGECRRPDSPAAVPAEFSAELWFGRGVSAGFFCSFRKAQQQWANVMGTVGSLHAYDFTRWCVGPAAAFSVRTPDVVFDGCDLTNRGGTGADPDVPVSPQAKMIQTFAVLALGGKPDPRWGEMALMTQHVLDACLLSARNDGAMVRPGPEPKR